MLLEFNENLIFIPIYLSKKKKKKKSSINIKRRFTKLVSSKQSWTIAFRHLIMQANQQT